MPIKSELRWFYPIDWPQISHWVRFVRAKGRCQMCGRPHGVIVRHLGDGRWWDEERRVWRDGKGRTVPSPYLRRRESSRFRAYWTDFRRSLDVAASVRFSLTEAASSSASARAAFTSVVIDSTSSAAAVRSFWA